MPDLASELQPLSSQLWLWALGPGVYPAQALHPLALVSALLGHWAPGPGVCPAQALGHLAPSPPSLGTGSPGPVSTLSGQGFSLSLGYNPLPGCYLSSP